MPKEANFSRQSFLGSDSQSQLESTTVAIVGLGGGGSHIVQQLAHIGFMNYVLFDSDVISDSNLNRLVGGRQMDVDDARPKTAIARRIIKGIRPKAKVKCISDRWQNASMDIKRTSILFGCVDSFAERRELEQCSRRYLIPYIDIGMDVHCIEGAAPRMAGQVILSMPGDLCMYCMGFLNESNLAKEAAKYGDVGGRPQVVWPNGILASTAVDVAVKLLTNWAGRDSICKYYSYDGNNGTIQPHTRLQFLKKCHCEHYEKKEVGDPVLFCL